MNGAEEFCLEITAKYYGKTIEEIAELIDYKDDLYKKDVCINIIRAIPGFDKIVGRYPIRSLSLKQNKQHRYDHKCFAIDFDEIKNKDLSFEESQFYRYFKNSKTIFAIYEIPDEERISLRHYKFIGFKELGFSEEFIDTHVKNTWGEIRRLVNNHELKEIISRDKYGMPRLNPSGNVLSAPNFPKSKNHVVFVRGGAANSNDKPLEINGIRMYKQYIWVKGAYLASLTSSMKFI